MYQFNNKEDLLHYISDQILSSAEVAELIGATKQTVSRLTKKGALKPIKEKPTFLYFKPDVEEYLKELEQLREKYRPYDKK